MDRKIIPRGIRNNNPLNIRVGNTWKGEVCIKSDPEFEEFESMLMGLRAGFIILRKYMSGYNGLTQRFNTIEKMISRWAPKNENNTQAYIERVCKLTGIPARQQISFSERNKMVAIVDAMVRVECGQAVSKELIESAYDLI